MQTTAIATSTVPQGIPLSLLVESPTNPRQHFEEDNLIELAETLPLSCVMRPTLTRWTRRQSQRRSSRVRSQSQSEEGAQASAKVVKKAA